TGAAAFHARARFGKHRATASNDRYARLLGTAPDIQLIEPGLGRLEGDAIRLVPDAFHGAVYTNHPVDTVIIWFYFVVRNGPCLGDAVCRLEIIRPHP